jgi:hypothetical protein
MGVRRSAGALVGSVRRASSRCAACWCESFLRAGRACSGWRGVGLVRAHQRLCWCAREIPSRGVLAGAERGCTRARSSGAAPGESHISPPVLPGPDRHSALPPPPAKQLFLISTITCPVSNAKNYFSPVDNFARFSYFACSRGGKLSTGGIGERGMKNAPGRGCRPGAVLMPSSRGLPVRS